MQVVPLDWREWLASIAIGSGAIPLSLITRVISNNVPCGAWGPDRFDAVTQQEEVHPHVHAHAHVAHVPARLSPSSINRVVASPGSVTSMGHDGVLAEKSPAANLV